MFSYSDSYHLASLWALSKDRALFLPKYAQKQITDAGIPAGKPLGVYSDEWIIFIINSVKLRKLLVKILMGMSGITTSTPHDREHSRRRKQASQDFYRQIRPACFFLSPALV